MPGVGAITQTNVNDNNGTATLIEGVVALAVYNNGAAPALVNGFSVKPGCSFNMPWLGKTYGPIVYDFTATICDMAIWRFTV